MWPHRSTVIAQHTEAASGQSRRGSTPYYTRIPPLAKARRESNAGRNFSGPKEWTSSQLFLDRLSSRCRVTHHHPFSRASKTRAHDGPHTSHPTRMHARMHARYLHSTRTRIRQKTRPRHYQADANSARVSAAASSHDRTPSALPSAALTMTVCLSTPRPLTPYAAGSKRSSVTSSKPWRS